MDQVLLALMIGVSMFVVITVVEVILRKNES